MPNDPPSSTRPANVADALPLDNAFWQFSLAVYAGEGVASECLLLQESRGIDVNLLLYGAWLGWRGIALSEDEFAAAARLVDDWHRTVVRTLRGVRTHIKTLGVPAFEPYRTRVKKAELEAEQIEQALLFRNAPAAAARAPVERAAAIAANIAHYLGDGAAAPRLTAAALAKG
jgi:uncharacterized protein (TIGR02444 family)